MDVGAYAAKSDIALDIGACASEVGPSAAEMGAKAAPELRN